MHTTNLGIRSALVLLLMAATASAGKIIYVDDDAPGANNGSSWIDAYRSLQDALPDASDGDEIRVAQGVYRPDQGGGITPGDRGAAFTLRPGVPIRGGYAGCGSADPNAKNVKRDRTVLSGDLAGDDVEVRDPCDLSAEPSRAENSEHILTGGGVLDGFTVTSANCSYSGGGIVMSEADMVVIDCIFTANSAGYCGGAMTGWNSQIVFERCSFIGNAAAGNGGAVFMDTCTCRDGYLGCVDCKFINNSAGGDGGAIHIGDATYMLTSLMNCLIVGNKAGGYGAALNAHVSFFGTTLVNCTVSGNWTKSEGPCPYEYGSVSLINSIFWFNEGSTICPAPGSYLYSFPGYGTGEPCFVSPGYWDADGLWVDGDYRLCATSPCCIDAGDPEFICEPANPRNPGGTYIHDPEPYIIRSSDRDLDGRPRVVGGRVDMGAYEYQLPKIVYVDDDAAGANDGSSWADAYNYLQDALMRALDGDEIHVAQGTYRPDQGEEQQLENREATFRLIDGVTVLGGYAGIGELDPDVRNIQKHQTILTGDISDDEDACHVVTGGGADASAVLDGFVITGGTASSACDCWLGGGMYNYAGSPTVANCTFTDNWALNYGGGMCNDGNSSPLIMNCTFIGNSATDGGAVDNEYGNPTFINCIFVGNWVDEYNADSFSGGAMYNFHSSPTLTNCTVSGNKIHRWWCYCGGIYNRGDDSRPMLTNCILWGNIDQSDDIQQAQLAGGLPIVSYCCIQGLKDDFPGKGNFGYDPLFAIPGYWNSDGTPDDPTDDRWVDGDYHLKSQAGRWDSNDGLWVMDDVTSPCIDAGDPMSPIGLEPFPNGGRINMGAYGGTAEASKSYFDKPPCELIVAGDINGDCQINFEDFRLMALHWLEHNQP